jgi:hypothetical protein
MEQKEEPYLLLTNRIIPIVMNTQEIPRPTFNKSLIKSDCNINIPNKIPEAIPPVRKQ